MREEGRPVGSYENKKSYINYKINELLKFFVIICGRESADTATNLATYRISLTLHYSKNSADSSCVIFLSKNTSEWRENSNVHISATYACSVLPDVIVLSVGAALRRTLVPNASTAEDNTWRMTSRRKKVISWTSILHLKMRVF